MSTLFESYTTGDDSANVGHGDIWQSMTFTPQQSHTITSVKLKVYGFGAAGTVTVGIRATDPTGHYPVGADLCSGTLEQSTLELLSPGAWATWTLGAGYALASGTMYAIVVRTTAATDLHWRYDSTNPGDLYPRGGFNQSMDAGATWTGYLSLEDQMFEEWGDSNVVCKQVLFAGDVENYPWEGQWLTATAYTANDCVYNDGSSYVCILAHTSAAADEPGTGANWTTYWSLLVQGADATSVDAAGAVMEGDYAAYSILAADTVDAPAPLSLAVQSLIVRLAAGIVNLALGEQTVLGRLTGGSIKGLSAAELLTLSAAMPLAGGSFTGAVEFNTEATFDAEVANVIAAGIVTVNWTSGPKQKLTLSETLGAGDLTFTAPSGVANLLLKIVSTGAYTIAWPAAVKWPDSTAPTLTDTGTDIVTFYWDGTNYHGCANLAFGVPA